MKIKVKGWAKLTKQQIEEKFYNINKACGLILQGNIQSFTPVDTGLLKNSIFVAKTTSDDFTVGVPVMSESTSTGEVKSLEYAKWVNYGTSKMYPRLFMQKGLNRFIQSQDYVKMLKREFNNA